jgi:cytochrome c oxidase subunit 2
VIRYRSKGRPREVEGSQVRGHTKLELAWTAGPVILLAIIAGFVFWKVSDIGASSSLTASEQAKDEITIVGHQYYWDFIYPNGAVSVDRLRLPFDRKVQLTIRSADVAHSWWIPALGGKMDAIPGKTNHLTLRPTKLGTFPGQCAEFCGLLHAAMLANAEVMPADRYDAWVSARANAQLALGKETFVGVCAKCHGLAAQGGVGPNIAQNPLLGDKKGISNIIRHGTGKMPAVGNDWSQAQLDATVAYLRQRFAQGGSGGSQG